MPIEEEGKELEPLVKDVAIDARLISELQNTQEIKRLISITILSFLLLKKILKN